jgi:chaperonin GroES
MATKVVPLTDHIVLKPVEQEEITSSGLVIPDSAKETPQHGHVVAVGPGKMNEAGTIETIELSEGDRILYQKYTGQEITVDKQEYIVIRFQDVLARLEEDAASANGATARASSRARR